MPTTESMFLIGAGHPALPGHFPGAPVVPGVVLLDMVLRALERALGQLPATLQLPQAKFQEPLLPGQLARIELRIDSGRSLARFSIFRGERPLAAGSVGWQASA